MSIKVKEDPQQQEIAPAEVIVNDEPKLHETFEPGDVAHQGDIMIICLKELPIEKSLRPNRQLAEGNTQGSRHVMSRGAVYDCPKNHVAKAIKEACGMDIGLAYIGPVFVSPEAPTCDDLTHPEHGNQGFPAGSVCAVVYQRNLDQEQREVLARD